MELWRVLVLGLLKQGINCDYDRLHDLANQHGDVRRMLGISDVLGAETFSYRTLARNVALLTPDAGGGEPPGGGGGPRAGRVPPGRAVASALR